MTIIIVLIGLFLILKFWRSLVILGIIMALGVFGAFMMSILNVWIGIDANTILKVVLIIIAILVVGSMIIGNLFDKILTVVATIFK